MHETEEGKKRYHPSNLTKCEDCGRVIMKSFVNQHTCNNSSIIMLPEKLKVGEPAREKDGKRMKFMPAEIICEFCGSMVHRHRLRVSLHRF